MGRVGKIQARKPGSFKLNCKDCGYTICVHNLKERTPDENCFRGGANATMGRAGRPLGTFKPESEKRKRIQMTTVKPENHKYLADLKADGFSLAKIFDQMIEHHKAEGNSR